MQFNGSIIKDKAKEAGLSILRLAEELGVSRQAINSWVGGQIPRGQHLVKLCALLNVKPADFFEAPTESLISVPLHRTIGKKAVTPIQRELSQDLAKQYLNLFRQAPTVSFLPVVRVKERTTVNAAYIANKFRELSGVEDGKPMDFKSSFRLLSQLGIYTIFRSFPGDLQKHSYAFYSRIARNRVVFVNFDTCPLDLIFFLLHETVHAIRDEDPGLIDYAEEEAFCDEVAELTQFPDFYVDNVAKFITENHRPATMINRLKEVSQTNRHSVFGIYYRLLHKGLMPAGLNVGGAAKNLSRNIPVLRDIFYNNADARKYIDILFNLSPLLMDLIKEQVPDCSLRKLGEWLDLETSMDAQAVMDEIVRRKDTK